MVLTSTVSVVEVAFGAEETGLLVEEPVLTQLPLDFGPTSEIV